MAAEYCGVTIATKELIDRGLKLGAYTDATGWSHRGLVQLAESIGLRAMSGHASVEDLRAAIDRDEVAIVSVKPDFTAEKTFKERVLFWKRYGGHLVTIIGYRLVDDRLSGFVVHHTSSEGKDEARRFVPIETFNASYTGRGIVIGRLSR